MREGVAAGFGRGGRGRVMVKKQVQMPVVVGMMMVRICEGGGVLVWGEDEVVGERGNEQVHKRASQSGAG